jgi:hypothetical protein
MTTTFSSSQADQHTKNSASFHVQNRTTNLHPSLICNFSNRRRRKPNRLNRQRQAPVANRARPQNSRGSRAVCRRHANDDRRRGYDVHGRTDPARPDTRYHGARTSVRHRRVAEDGTILRGLTRGDGAGRRHGCGDSDDGLRRRRWDCIRRCRDAVQCRTRDRDVLRLVGGPEGDGLAGGLPACGPCGAAVVGRHDGRGGTGRVGAWDGGCGWAKI